MPKRKQKSKAKPKQTEIRWDSKITTTAGKIELMGLSLATALLLQEAKRNGRLQRKYARENKGHAAQMAANISWACTLGAAYLGTMNDRRMIAEFAASVVNPLGRLATCPHCRCLLSGLFPKTTVLDDKLEPQPSVKLARKHRR
jgi:hypothetical protein